MSVSSLKREYRELPLALIDEPAHASRSSMSDELMDALVASIRELGLLQPMGVASVGDRYEVIYGHRRRIASERAGLVVAPCIVFASREDALAAAQHAENARREELSPADEAIWYAELLELRAGGDVDTLCGLVGERRGRVEARLNLLRGDEEVFRAVERGEVGVGVAEQLNRCTEVLHRRMLLFQARTGGATVATVSGWIAEWKSVHEPATRNVATDLAAPAPGPVMQQDFFTCVLCKSTKDPHLMQPRNFHTYCEHAFFNEMLELWNHRNDYVRMPRTVDEATALLVELSQRFPTMLDA